MHCLAALLVLEAYQSQILQLQLFTVFIWISTDGNQPQNDLISFRLEIIPTDLRKSIMSSSLAKNTARL